MPDPLFFDDNAAGSVSGAERELALGLFKSVPQLEFHFEKGRVDFNSWSSSDGMLFMEELLRCCDRLVAQTVGKTILPGIFSYLEDLAVQLDSGEPQKGASATDLPPELRAIDSLLFTFTDNPTGEDATLRKLAP